MTERAIERRPMQHRVCVAPMMDHTNRHCRYFLRLIAPKVGLYTEMITARAILHGDPRQLLAFDPVEHPVALQLGGSDPGELAAASRLVRRDFAYDEINLNVGCPSDRVQSGRFGACLMAEPGLVAECVGAIGEAWGLPPTIKCRIGIDDQDQYAFLSGFVARLAEAGCTTFIVHARKAILRGLTPKENRSIPPLRYETVARLKDDFPWLTIVINGGIDTTAAVAEQLEKVDGVMIGRQAVSEPFLLGSLQAEFIDGDEPGGLLSREEVVAAMVAYARRECVRGVRLHHVTRHMLGLYARQPGAAAWRRFLSEAGTRRDADPEIILQGLNLLRRAA